MPRLLAASSLILATLAAGDALAQSGRGIPVERDLDRYQRLEDRLERNGTGSLGPYPGYGYAYGVTRNRRYAPGAGVAAPQVPGFDGPPGGFLRDSVGNSGPLPPGSPVNAGNE
jgi:hypothetical protein